MDECTRELPCQLTDEEMAERSDRLARTLDARETLDAERAKVAKRYKAELAVHDSEVRALGEAVRTRQEMRDVECYTEQRDDGAIIVSRRDTGEVIEQRHADPDVQMRLRLGG